MRYALPRDRRSPTKSWLTELAKEMDFWRPAQIGELAKALGPTMPRPIKLALGPTISSATYIAEVGKAANQWHPAQIARLAKTVGPAMPRAMADFRRPATAEMIRTIAGTSAFKSLLAAMTEPQPSTPASPLHGLAELEADLDGLTEIDADLVEPPTEVTTSSPPQTREMTSTEIAVAWALAFFIVWMWWAASRLNDLDRSGEMLQNMDKSELLAFAYSTVDLPSYLFGLPGVIHTYLIKRKRG